MAEWGASPSRFPMAMRGGGAGGSCCPGSCSHVDPLLQRVLQVLLADGMRQRPESWLELDNGRGQVLEPAAQLHLVLQNTNTFSWGDEDQGGGVTGKSTQDLGGVSKSHPVFL